MFGEQALFEDIVFESELVYNKKVYTNPTFLTPEVIQNQMAKRSEIQDAQIYWDFGIILYNLATGNQAPF